MISATARCCSAAWASGSGKVTGATTARSSVSAPSRGVGCLPAIGFSSCYSPGGFQVGSTSEYWVAVCPSGTVALTGTPGGGTGTPTGGTASGAG